MLTAALAAATAFALLWVHGLVHRLAHQLTSQTVDLTPVRGAGWQGALRCVRFFPGGGSGHLLGLPGRGEDGGLSSRVAWGAAAGFAADLGFAAVLIIGLAETNPAASIHKGLAAAGALFFVNQALLLWVGYNQSDLRTLVALLDGGARAERRAATWLIEHAASESLRPREWPDALIRRIEATVDDLADDAHAALLAYYHRLDKGDLERADQLLCYLLDPGVGARRDTVAVAAPEALYLSWLLWRRGDALEADRLYKAATLRCSARSNGPTRNRAPGRTLVYIRAFAGERLAGGRIARVGDVLTLQRVLALAARGARGYRAVGVTRARRGECEREWMQGLLEAVTKRLNDEGAAIDQQPLAVVSEARELVSLSSRHTT